MNCPRCVTEPLDERVRDGVMIDVCGSCRGIWLDRGELEKLTARARDEEAQYRRPRNYDEAPPSSDDPRRRHRKKSWMDIWLSEGFGGCSTWGAAADRAQSQLIGGVAA